MVGKTCSGIMVRDISNSCGHRPHHIVNYPRREYIVTKPKALTDTFIMTTTAVSRGRGREGGLAGGAYHSPIENFAWRERNREETEGGKEKRNKEKYWEIYNFLHTICPVYLVVHSSFLKNSEVLYW